MSAPTNKATYSSGSSNSNSGSGQCCKLQPAQTMTHTLCPPSAGLTRCGCLPAAWLACSGAAPASQHAAHTTHVARLDRCRADQGGGAEGGYAGGDKQGLTGKQAIRAKLSEQHAHWSAEHKQPWGRCAAAHLPSTHPDVLFVLLRLCCLSPCQLFTQCRGLTQKDN